MAVSKAQQKAVTKYDAKAYDKTLLRLPKGRLDTVKAHASARGESTNGFIGRAILEAMERDSGTAPEIAGKPAEMTPGAGVVSLPSEAYECAVAASEAAGEGLPDFVARAVEIQAKRDKASLAMGINPATGGRGGAEAGGTHGN